MTDFIEAIKTGIANAKNKAKIRQEVCEVFDKLNNSLQDVTNKKVRLRAVFYDDYEMDFSVVKNEEECYENLKIRFGQEGFPLELQLNAVIYTISSISQLEICLNRIISSADFGFAIYCEEVNVCGDANEPE